MGSKVLSKLRHTTVTASEAKNEFGQMLETALRGDVVVITKHDTPKAVLLSIEELEAIAARGSLDTLSREFDAKYVRMQKPGFDKAMSKAFGATPKQLGANAVKAKRSR